MKRVLIAIVVLAVLGGAFFAYRRFSAQQQQEAMLAELQTANIERGTLVATIGATGKVHSNQSALLSWQTSGTVEQVNVEVGDQIVKDQELASISQTSLPQNVILAQADLVSAQRELDNLLNSSLQQAQALQAVEDAQQALEDALNPELAQARAQEAIADAEKAVELAERRLRNLQSTASQADIDAAEAQVVLAEDALEKAREKYEPYANKPEDNLTRANLQSKLAEAQQTYDAAVRYLNSLLGTGSPTEIAVAQADLNTAQAQLLDAQREYERLKDGPNPADIALLEAQLEEAQREWERLQDGPDPADIAVVEARIAAAQATLDQAHITAPFEGIVTDVISKPGDQVNPGTIAFRIDDLSRLLVDLEVSEIDINQIEVGQQVLMSFDAILAQEYTGNVLEVALVGSEQQGVVNFNVTVELQDPDESVKPGMTSAVNIVVSQLEEALLVPNRAVRVLEGQRVVYTLSSTGELEPIPVILGASSDTHSEVLDGDLQEDDAVVLNPPVNFDFNGPPPFVRNQD
ncbi:MAG: efflux RND transporter periplasmic adaptor subunit [Anaerolineales bacterium]|jgi:HlyD family secretion protein